MNSKNKSIGQYIIDLTPLLDVVLIMLLIVIVNNDVAEKNNKQAQDIVNQMEITTQDTVAEITANYDAAALQNATYEQLYSYVNVITVYASFQPSRIEFREIHIWINGEEKEEPIPLNPSNSTEAWDECKLYIENYLAENNDKPTVLSYSSEKMLYRDTESINSLFSDLYSSIDNTYVNELPETEDE